MDLFLGSKVAYPSAYEFRGVFLSTSRILRFFFKILFYLIRKKKNKIIQNKWKCLWGQNLFSDLPSNLGVFFYQILSFRLINNNKKKKIGKVKKSVDLFESLEESTNIFYYFVDLRILARNFVFSFLSIFNIIEDSRVSESKQLVKPDTARLSFRQAR